MGYYNSQTKNQDPWGNFQHGIFGIITVVIFISKAPNSLEHKHGSNMFSDALPSALCVVS